MQKQIQGGVDGTVKETPKENSPVFKKCVYTLVGNNDQSLDVSAAKARELGYTQPGDGAGGCDRAER